MIAAFILAFSTLLAIEAIFFVTSHKRNRRMRYERLGMVLKRHVEKENGQ